jgi:hypothetical protein
MIINKFQERKVTLQGTLEVGHCHTKYEGDCMENSDVLFCFRNIQESSKTKLKKKRKKPKPKSTCIRKSLTLILKIKPI